MTKTLTLEGDITAVDTRTLITTQGSVTAPSLTVPAGMNKIVAISAAAAQDGAATGGAVYFIRLGGNAIQRGEQTLVVGAGGTIAVQTGSDQNYPVVPPTVMENTDIDVTPSDTLSVAAEMAGSDLGTVRIAVTLVFAAS